MLNQWRDDNENALQARVEDHPLVGIESGVLWSEVKNTNCLAIWAQLFKT